MHDPDRAIQKSSNDEHNNSISQEKGWCKQFTEMHTYNCCWHSSHHHHQQQQHLSHDIYDNEEKNEGEKISDLKRRQSGLSIEIDHRQAEGDLHNGLHCKHKCQQNCKAMAPASADFNPVARRRRVQKSSNPIHHQREKSKVGDCDDHSVHQTWCKSSKSTGQLGFTRPQSSNPHHHHQQQQQPSSLKIPNPSEICLTTPILKTLSKSFLPKNPNQSPADSCPLWYVSLVSTSPIELQLVFFVPSLSLSLSCLHSLASNKSANLGSLQIWAQTGVSLQPQFGTFLHFSMRGKTHSVCLTTPHEVSRVQIWELTKMGSSSAFKKKQKTKQNSNSSSSSLKERKKGVHWKETRGRGREEEGKKPKKPLNPSPPPNPKNSFFLHNPKHHSHTHTHTQKRL